MQGLGGGPSKGLRMEGLEGSEGGEGRPLFQAAPIPQIRTCFAPLPPGTAPTLRGGKGYGGRWWSLETQLRAAVPALSHTRVGPRLRRGRRSGIQP